MRKWRGGATGHAAHYLNLAEQATDTFRGRTAQEQGFDLLKQERRNFGVARIRLDESCASDALIRLAGALTCFWYIRSHSAKGGPGYSGRWAYRHLGRQTRIGSGPWSAPDCWLTFKETTNTRSNG